MFVRVILVLNKPQRHAVEDKLPISAMYADILYVVWAELALFLYTNYKVLISKIQWLFCAFASAFPLKMFFYVTCTNENKSFMFFLGVVFIF